ncbi:hypothetical protein O1611_g2449 [Lasiodiplodia mahajangana]|uniref:Uncharacterized protein n=1 Tax=Lasiodiplodia mahajangana TaxID=1108764 RepID=A0ACC2JV14_9PEZI|nr:hypothetical protein O1611_g2449 [Lasiodiplodia mahajangana]
MEDFFDNQGPKLHRAYTGETHWLVDQRRFLSGREPPIQKLKNLLTLYQTPLNGLDPSITGNHIPLDYSWDDVLTQLNIARASCPTNAWKTSRKADRFLAKVASYSEKWIDLIPDEYGLSIVRGGLALVFSTAAQKVENHEKIVQAFEDLPDIIRTMETACKLFGPNEEEDIKGLAKSFYDELCSDIPDLIQILDGKSSRFKRTINRLTGGTIETKKIDEVLNKIGNSTNKLESAIKRIKMKLDAKEQSEIAAMRLESKATQVSIGLLHSDMRQIPTRSEMADSTRTFHQSLMRSIREEMRSSLQDVLRHQTPGDFAAEAKTFVVRMIEENESLKQLNAQLSAHNEYQRSREPSPIGGPLISVFDLMRILDVDHRHATEDLGFVLKQAARMSSEDKGRARWLMRTPKFHNWMKVPQHSLLLVDGAMTPERVSPMSVLTGTLAASLLQTPAAIAIYFFCGKNLDVDTEDDLSGPSGMLRSLIMQLTLQINPSPNLSGINSHEFLHECYRRHFPALCEVLRLLVEQIPSQTTLYCFLDGVSWYEQEHWVGELLFFVGLLKDLMKRPTGPYVKLLMTSSNRSTAIRSVVNAEWEYVSLAAASVDSMPLVSPSVMAAMAPFS